MIWIQKAQFYLIKPTKNHTWIKKCTLHCIISCSLEMPIHFTFVSQCIFQLGKIVVGMGAHWRSLLTRSNSDFEVWSYEQSLFLARPAILNSYKLEHQIKSSLRFFLDMTDLLFEDIELNSLLPSPDRDGTWCLVQG